MKVRVLCVGNNLARDDGVGMYVAEILETCNRSADVVVERRPSLGFELLDLLDEEQHLVIVDAMRTGLPPGTCRTLDVDVAASFAGAPYCGHAIGLAEVLAVAAHLQSATLPTTLTIIGVEAQDLDGFGTELSAPVRDALPELVERILVHVGAAADVVDQATQLARTITPLALEEALGVADSPRCRTT